MNIEMMNEYKKLYLHCKNWIEDNSFHEESFILDDLYFEKAQELIEGIGNIVGFFKYPEED